LLSTTDYDETARAADELEALDAGPPDWEWFKLTIARLWSIRRELLIALTRSDFVRGRTAHGLKRSETLVALDPCDEEARVLRLKLLLARGDRAAAFSEFREYARILHDDLGIEPSPDVLALLRSEDAVRSERPAIRR
jgi:DNA-binding SARP family transcriptional activator